jgi:pyridoxine kinase
MKKIAAVNDLSGFGKCSLTAAIPVISALGVQCCPLITGVFSNQTGYNSFYCRDFTDDMEPCIEEWKKLQADFDGILTGFIANGRQGEIIIKLIDAFRKEGTVVAVDPVMADDGEIYKCYDEACVKAIMSLSERADIITPNLTELCILSGRKYDEVSSLGKDDLLDSIKEMSALQNKEKAKIVVTSGIHISENEVANTVYDNGAFDVIVTPHYGGSFSGTGDILASFVTAQYIKGVSVKEAVKQASQFICKSIEETIKDTKGEYNRADGIHFERYLSELGDL